MKLLLILLFISQLVLAQNPEQVRLETINPAAVKPNSGELKTNKSFGGNQLNINGTGYSYGLGVQANSEITYELDQNFKNFTATIGLDNELKIYNEKTGLCFQVFGDGEKLFESEKLTNESQAVSIEIDIHGVDILKLVVQHSGEKMRHGHADWVNPTLTRATEKKEPVTLATKYEIKSKNIELGLSGDGQISGVKLGKNKLFYAMKGHTELALCRKSTPVSAKKLDNGGIEFSYSLEKERNNEKCKVTERYYPTSNSIRWELEIEGNSTPWTSAINSSFYWPKTETSKIWLPWGNPDGKAIKAEWDREFEWQDPLVSVPFYNQTFNFGMPDYPEGNRGYVPYDGNTMSIPMITVSDPGKDIALSVICSPKDRILFENLDITSFGDFKFSRQYNRICSERMVKFSADLVAHPADWRGGLQWVTNTYPEYFNPALPLADEIAGCGAYSSYEGPLDAKRFQKMAYRLNWKASFDFPYMGMFIPPVKGDAEKWTKFNAGSDGSWNGKSDQTSVDQLNKYGEQMRSMGFYVLDYFNMTEIGYELRGIDAPDAKSLSKDELWRNPKAFIQENLSDALLMTNWKGYSFLGGNPLFTWGDAVIVDPATPGYQKFLLGQADQLIRHMKFSSGICIDRTDHTRAFNTRSDDGYTFWHDQPARSLVNSWKETLGKVSEKFHQAGRVIYVNDHNHRIDMMKDIDGFYDEAGHLGTSLNNTSFLALRKPVVTWTASTKTLGTNPDKYFQSLLYMGAFPTAPVTGNDHTIVPDPTTDTYYLQYGPLLNLLRGKKWVLEPHVLQVENNAAKANLFKVPEGLVMPVVFATTEAPVKVKILHSAEIGDLVSASALSPDSEKETPIKITSGKGYYELNVPAGKRGAMVRIRQK
jgi:hypothetical protein